jgi:hypothetical protein
MKDIPVCVLFGLWGESDSNFYNYYRVGFNPLF